MRIAASRSRGYVRSTSLPSTTPASAALASPGEIAAAMSRTGVPDGTVRFEPSGSVTVISLIDGLTLEAFSSQLPASSSYVDGEPSFRTRWLEAGSWWLEAVLGRHGWTRTT